MICLPVLTVCGPIAPLSLARSRGARAAVITWPKPQRGECRHSSYRNRNRLYSSNVFVVLQHVIWRLVIVANWIIRDGKGGWERGDGKGDILLCCVNNQNVPFPISGRQHQENQPIGQRRWPERVRIVTESHARHSTAPVPVYCRRRRNIFPNGDAG